MPTAARAASRSFNILGGCRVRSMDNVEPQERKAEGRMHYVFTTGSGATSRRVIK